MAYVECFVAAVPTDNEETYKKHAIEMGAVFKDYGAKRVVDAWGADVPDGEMTSFPKAVMANEDETIAFGWVEWESKSARDEGMEKAMADERMRMHDMPFDGKRLIFAGFEQFSDQ